MGAILRCVNDCVEEVYFLLEKYPETSNHIDKFIKGFFESKIDGDELDKTPAVKRKKIRSAFVRLIGNKPIDEKLRISIGLVYKIGCGYVHADYETIMSTYEETFPNPSFTLLSDSPNVQKKEMLMQLVKNSYPMVLMCMSFVCSTFNKKEIKIATDKLIYESHEYLPG